MSAQRLLLFTLLLPFFARKRLDHLNSLLRQRGVQVGEFFRHPGVEVFHYVGQLAGEGVGALHLGLRRAALVEDDVAVEVGQVFAQTFLAGDRAAFLRGDDLLA